MEASREHSVDTEWVRVTSPRDFGTCSKTDNDHNNDVPIRRELDCMAFPHFAPLLEASQDYASCSGCRFRSSSFDNLIVGLRRRSRSSKEAEELALELCGEAFPSSSSSAPPPRPKDEKSPCDAGSESNSGSEQQSITNSNVNAANETTNNDENHTITDQKTKPDNDDNNNDDDYDDDDSNNNHNHNHSGNNTDNENHNHTNAHISSGKNDHPTDRSDGNDDPNRSGTRSSGARSPRSLAKLHAAPWVRDFAQRLRQGDLDLQKELESAFYLVMLESIRNSMVSACQALAIFPPPPASVDLEVPSDDSNFEDMTATLPVIAQRLWNDQQKREQDQIESQATPASSSQCGGFASSLYRKAMTAAFIVDFAHEVGAEVPPMPESLHTMFKEFSSKADTWSSHEQRQMVVAASGPGNDAEHAFTGWLDALTPSGISFSWGFTESSPAHETSDDVAAEEVPGTVSPSAKSQEDCSGSSSTLPPPLPAAAAAAGGGGGGDDDDPGEREEDGSTSAELQSSSFFSAEGASRMLSVFLNSSGCVARSKSL